MATRNAYRRQRYAASGLRRKATALAVIAAAMVAAPVHAQQAAPQPPTSNAPPSVQPGDPPPDEVVITGRRGKSDFQRDYEFHKEEYARLKKKFEKAESPGSSPAERKLRVPETITGTLPGKPTVTEKLDWGAPTAKF